jgi:KDO2-lipid IV(A) lauroyltransferase
VTLASKVLVKDSKQLAYQELSQLHLQKLEQQILEYPARWLWSHKRWKRDIPSDLEELKSEQQSKFNSKYRN